MSGIETDWVEVDRRIRALAKRQSGLDYEIGVELLTAHGLGLHRRLGMGSFSEYVERLFGKRLGSISERLRVARALESLPALAARPSVALRQPL